MAETIKQRVEICVEDITKWISPNLEKVFLDNPDYLNYTTLVYGGFDKENGEVKIILKLNDEESKIKESKDE